jgi:radical SAM protein with 4Fe4S-binding SPASM domain
MDTGCLGLEGDDLNRYLSKAAQNKYPFTVSFELTRRCCFRCVHCYLGDQGQIRQHQAQELDTAAVMELLDELTAAGVLFLTLTGGDPMLRSDFIPIYRHAVRLGLLVTVFCTGALVTQEVVQIFQKYPPRRIEITLYGATPETFAAVTQQAQSFAACWAGLERLLQAGMRPALKTIAMTLNQGEVQELWTLAASKGLTFRHDCSIIPVLPHEDNGGYSNTSQGPEAPLSLRLSPEQAAACDVSIPAIREALDNKGPSLLENSTKLYHCGAARSSCHITPYGSMQPCIITSQPQFPLGTGQSFQEHWQQLSQLFPEQECDENFPCNRCQNRASCTGCSSNFVLESSDQNHPPSFYCEYAVLRQRTEAIEQIPQKGEDHARTTAPLHRREGSKNQTAL